LEFDEFLRIEGCTTGKHLFVGPKRDMVRIVLGILIRIADDVVRISRKW
jgi:hypothetical protein